jgi:hypothetical protein
MVNDPGALDYGNTAADVVGIGCQTAASVGKISKVAGAACDMTATKFGGIFDAADLASDG